MNSVVIIDPDGHVTTGPPPDVPPWEDRHQAVLGIDEATLTTALGPQREFGGWLVSTPAGQAVIAPADGLDGAWDITGPNGILAAIAALILAATGRSRHCEQLVHPNRPVGAPASPCGRRFLHSGPHRSRQALSRYQRQANIRRQGR